MALICKQCFLGGLVGYPIVCVGIGALLGINGVKLAAFDFIGLVAILLLASLSRKDSQHDK